MLIRPVRSEVVNFDQTGILSAVYFVIMVAS
jgi:hypothetical protein